MMTSISPRRHVALIVVQTLIIALLVAALSLRDSQPVNAQQAVTIGQIALELANPPRGDRGTIIMLMFELTSYVSDANMAVSPSTNYTISVTNTPNGTIALPPGTISLVNNVGGSSSIFAISLNLGNSILPGFYNNLVVTATGTYTSVSGQVRTVSASTFGRFIVTVNGQIPTATPTSGTTPGQCSCNYLPYVQTGGVFSPPTATPTYAAEGAFAPSTTPRSTAMPTAVPYRHPNP